MIEQARQSPPAKNEDDQQRESVFEDDEDVSVELQSIRDEDDLSSSTGYQNKKNQTDSGNQDGGIAKRESRQVFVCRVFVTLMLFFVTGGVAWGVFYYVSDSENVAFVEDFRTSSDKLLDAIGSTLDRSLGAVDNLMVSIVSYQEQTGSVWPNVTVPNFGVIAQKVLTLSKGVVIGMYPRVTLDQRKAWEAYALEHDAWVDESLKIQRGDPTFEGTNLESWSPNPYIHSYSGEPLPSLHKYYPTWQAAPVVPRYGAYNWDLNVPYGKELQAVEDSRHVTMGRTLNLPRTAQEAQEMKSTVNWISDLVGPDRSPADPLFPFYYPIVERATTSMAVWQEPAETHEVVGVLSYTLFWRELVRNILSPGSTGIHVVFGSDCNQTLTFLVDGPDAIFLGQGDRHDTEYNKYERFSYLHDLGRFALRDNKEKYTGFPLSRTYCPYWMRVYPSDDLKNKHYSNAPAIYTSVAVGIFVFTSLVFLVYDCISERRQKKVLQVAVQSTAVVASLFPQVVRDRLFTQAKKEQESALPKSKPHHRMETAKLRLQQFLRNDEDEIVQVDRHASSNQPIAELFSATTVMFADIAGFTAWSSVREPAQVFTLLETLYGSFDRIAARRGVFKVETIGDSYVAVAGLPEPRDDHAIVMAKFARDIREKMSELTKRLGRTLGPDTDGLELRIGLNSGPVTAGVLRGERSRFQLFGDTVNTAARMESTGKVSKIQASESTATLLRNANKGHWVFKRDGQVEAKGKGRVQTYWIEPTARQASSASSGEDDDDVEVQIMDEKMRRMVEWNVEIMAKLIKHIVSRREARNALEVQKQANSKLKTSSLVTSSALDVSTSVVQPSGTPLDEVREVIMLPEYDPQLAENPCDPATVNLNTSVTTQLREYVSLIASMYRENPFHNFEHASHVTMSVVKLLSRIVAPTDRVLKSAEEGHEKFVQTLHDHTYGITSDPLTQFACVFSALIHDVDHPGVPNSQLIKEESPLNILYKGKSLAEQNSVDISWRLLMEDQFEDLRNIICATQADMTRFRQLVVNGVMATDIMDRDLKNLRNQRWDKAFQEVSRLGESTKVNTNRKATIVIEHLIQASDVAHTMQHWHIFRKWNERLFTEMYNAYRSGRAERSPADFWYKGEIGFFDFYIIPLAKKLSDCGVFGVSSDEYLSYAMKNREEWQARGQEVVETMLSRFEVPKEVVGAKDEIKIADDVYEDSGTNKPAESERDNNDSCASTNAVAALENQCNGNAGMSHETQEAAAEGGGTCFGKVAI